MKFMVLLKNRAREMLQKQKQKKKKLCFFKAMSVKGTREVVLKEQNTLAIVQGYFFSFFLFSYFFFCKS